MADRKNEKKLNGKMWRDKKEQGGERLRMKWDETEKDLGWKMATLP